MLLENTERGLFCRPGNFYIDPWKAVDFALLTHAHSDHARWGCGKYLVAERGLNLFRERLGSAASIQTISFGQTVIHNGVTISFYPAGHILGSAQIRLEYQGEIWVVSGDYKIDADQTCDAFAPLRCHVFVTESTFGLPLYRWRAPSEIFSEINQWWRDNQTKERASLLFSYSLGKAQRILAELDGEIGLIFLHGAVAKFMPAYEQVGIRFPKWLRADPENVSAARGRALIIAPPSAAHTPWRRKLGDCSTAFASGWMQIRGNRRRRGIDRGFVLSDHVDWPGLLQTIKATGAETIWVTHGFTAPLVRWLREKGWKAEEIATRFPGQNEEENSASAPANLTGE
ncbi:MAG: ligase-associated DNA damage response exonuclease [Limisphaerales bacterium]